MLSWAAPWWLLGLLLLPVIRWLHRGGRHRRAVPVSYLALWRGAAAQQRAAGARSPPDPAWRRRALLAALLLVALAQPRWPSPRPDITLWVDDSISMLTREGAATRLAAGLAQARVQLQAEPHGKLRVRALSHPWDELGGPDDATAAQLVARSAASQSHAPAQAAAPPAALLQAGQLNWLITDGAEPELLAWPGGRQADRVIQVTGVTRNMGVQSLSARRHATEADQIELLIKLHNGGDTVETRELLLSTPSGVVARLSPQVQPGATAWVAASVLAAQVETGPLIAWLQPADALPEDDQLSLSLAALRRRPVLVDAACPAALVAAVRAHPALRVAAPAAGDADAVLDCGTRSADGTAGKPTVRVATDRLALKMNGTSSSAGTLQWSSAVAAAQRPQLDASRLQASARLQPGPSDTVLLALADAASGLPNGQPLIVSRSGPVRTLETAIDFASPALVGVPEIPLLVNLLFDHLLHGPASSAEAERLSGGLLDKVAVLDRGPAASRVVPAPPAPASAAATAGASAGPAADARPQVDLVQPLLMAALLVLLWEVLALVRQWLHLRPASAQRASATGPGASLE